MIRKILILRRFILILIYIKMSCLQLPSASIKKCIDCLVDEKRAGNRKSVRKIKCGKRVTINLNEGYTDFHFFSSFQ